VKLADAGGAIATAIAATDWKQTKTGETLSIATIAALDPAQPLDAKPLRDDLAKRKLKILDDRVEGNRVTIVVEDASGARARITVDQGGGAILLTARPANPKLPGKCVAIPQATHPVVVRATAIDQRGELRNGETFWDFKTERIHDVDGDGIADWFVPVAKDKHACPEEVSYRVFVARGSCGHDLGVIGPGTFQWDAATVALDASGFRPFAIESHTSKLGKHLVPETTQTTRRFEVKAGKYKQVDIKTQTGKCHHCATWHCTAK
jgi:hypothetical protein